MKSLPKVSGRVRRGVITCAASLLVAAFALVERRRRWPAASEA